MPVMHTCALWAGMWGWGGLGLQHTWQVAANCPLRCTRVRVRVRVRVKVEVRVRFVFDDH